MIRILSFVLIAIGLLGGAEKAAAAASDVVDRETLKNFVLEAKSLLESAQDEAARTAILETFRTSEEWRHGSIYIFITGFEGTSFFHATSPSREGTNNVDQEDSNGVKSTQQHIAAAQAGGGFCGVPLGQSSNRRSRRIPQGKLRGPHRDRGCILLHWLWVVSYC